MVCRVHNLGERFMKRLLPAIVTAAAAWLHGADASAEFIINLNNSGTTTFNQGLVTAITITASNAGVDVLALGSLQWGIQLVPQGAVTGSLDATSFSAPATGSPWSDPTVTEPVVASLTEGDINGTLGYYLMSITENALDNSGTILPGESRNLATVSITASNEAFGTWLLYLVNETDSETELPLTSITTDAFDSVQFANLLAPAAPSTGLAFHAATFIVVPEPASCLMAVIGGAGVALALRRCHRRASQ